MVVLGSGSSCGHGKLPRLSEVGATSVVAIARAASTRPAPASKPPAPGAGSAVSASTALRRSPSHPGWACLRIAARPATWGAAIDVPDTEVYSSSTGAPIPVPAARPATMSTPGAMTSGFRPPSPMRGPRLENHAVVSLPSTAPTVSAASAAPGEVIVPGPSPELPAATTNRVSDVADSSSIAWLNGSVPSLTSPPRLRFTTSAS